MEMDEDKSLQQVDGLMNFDLFQLFSTDAFV